MKIDIDNLNEALQGLTGNDFAECERAERAAGNFTAMLQYSSSFLARLGAMALKMNPNEVKRLPINQYVQLTSAVGGFLFTTSEEDSTSVLDE